MSEKIYQLVLEEIRPGRDPLALLESCGCSGCPKSSWTDTVDKCECGQGCRCRCTLPAEVERRAQVAADNAAMVERARQELEAHYEALENDG